VLSNSKDAAKQRSNTREDLHDNLNTVLYGLGLMGRNNNLDLYP